MLSLSKHGAGFFNWLLDIDTGTHAPETPAQSPSTDRCDETAAATTADAFVLSSGLRPASFLWTAPVGRYGLPSQT